MGSNAAMMPPPLLFTGGPPNLIRGPVLLGISICTASFAIFITVVRFFVRNRRKQVLNIDDYTIAAAAVVAFMGTIFTILETSTPFGPRALQFDILGQPWFVMGAALSRISIGLFFARMLGSTARIWRIVLYVVVALLVAVNLVFSLLLEVECMPLQKLWDSRVKGTCWSQSARMDLDYVQGSFAVVSSFFLALVPLLLRKQLNVAGNKKWPLIAFAALSVCVGSFAIGRTIELSRGRRSFYTFDTFCAMLLAVLEQNVGIVAANLLASGVILTNWVLVDGTVEGRVPNAPPTEMRWPGSGGESNRTSVVSISDIKGPKPPSRFTSAPWPLNNHSSNMGEGDETGLVKRTTSPSEARPGTGDVIKPVQSLDGFELVRNKGGVKVVKTLSIDISMNQPQAVRLPPLPAPRQDSIDPRIVEEGAFI